MVTITIMITLRVSPCDLIMITITKKLVCVCVCVVHCVAARAFQSETFHISKCRYTEARFYCLLLLDALVPIEKINLFIHVMLQTKM